jgi:hypothetical protein
LAGLAAGGVATAQSGSFRQTCRNIQTTGGQLTAECADTRGGYHVSVLPYAQCRSEIANINGVLTCNGAVASGGAPVGDPDRGANDRGGYGRDDGGRGGDDRRRDNGGDFAAGAAVGAFAGALAGNPPPPAYGPAPAYGDQRYGDPRFDRRYAEGGWGYGRRPGEWVPIRDRAPWLEQRIERARDAGRLSSRDARNLHRSVDRLEDMERDMIRDGRYGPEQRAMLDQRFDELATRTRDASDRY